MWAEERATDPRPSHVSPPLPGTFGELLEPHMAGLAESYASYRQSGAVGMAQIARVSDGREPVAKLGPEPLHNLALHRRALEGALRATHAESARAPAALRLFSTMRHGDPFAHAMQAARLATLDILILLDQGRASDAATECADVLALGRDLSYPSVLGRMIGVTVNGIVAPACGRALSAASPEVLERTRPQLATIRAGTPRFAQILGREELFGQLWLSDVDPRMPESARTAVANYQELLKSSSYRLRNLVFRETAWAPFHAQMARYQDAQRLAWPDCAERMDEVGRRFEWNPLARADGFGRLLRRHRDSLLKLDVLICVASASLARARHSPLSNDAAALCPPPEAAATCGEQSAPLRIVADAQGSRVSVTLSDGSDYSVLLAEARK
jgi:hypothetical protein